ncbi:unnamed protein product, partial [Nesidiocoris tenuis]
MRSAGEIVGMVGRSGSQSKMVASQGKSADVTSAKIRHARPIVCPAHLVLRIIIYYGVVLAPCTPIRESFECNLIRVHYSKLCIFLTDTNVGILKPV